MAGRKPDYDVMIAVEYETSEGKKTRWHNLGAGWRTEAGHITFNMVTMPGVKLVLLEKADGEQG